MLDELDSNMAETNLSVKDLILESTCFSDSLGCIDSSQQSYEIEMNSQTTCDENMNEFSIKFKNSLSDEKDLKESSFKSRWSLEEARNIPEWHPPQRKFSQNSHSMNEIFVNGSTECYQSKQSLSSGSLSVSPPPFIPRNINAHQIFQGNLCSSHHVASSNCNNHTPMFVETSETQGENSSKPPHAPYVVNVFVNAHASFAVSVGDQGQIIQGPATVRMVSPSPPRPGSIPDQAGQIVHRVVDDNGILAQVFISSQSSPPVMSSSPQPPYGSSPFMMMHPPSYHHHPRHHHPASVNNPPCSSVNSNLDQRTVKRKERLQMKLQQRKSTNETSTEDDATDGNCLKVDNKCGHPSNGVLLPQKSGKKQFVEKDEDSTGDLKQLEIALSKIDDPKVLVVEVRSAVVRLNWCESCEPEIDPLKVKYRLLINKGKDDGPSFTEVYSGDALEIALNDLAPATTYFVKYQCWLDNAMGCLSPSVSFTTTSCEPEPPSWPKLVSKAKTSLQLKWNAAIDNGGKITGYILECDEGRGSSKYLEIYKGPQKQFKVIKLLPSTGYRFRLAALNNHGKSPYSESICYSTNGPVPSQTDPPMMSHPTSKTLTISWVKRPSDEAFTLQMEDETTGHGFLTVYNGSDLSYKVCNLKRNTDYKFRLQAKNEEGSSKWSDVVHFRTLPDRPLPPLRPQIKGKTLSTSFKFYWDEPKDFGGINIEHYTVYLDSGSGFHKFIDTSDREIIIENLTPGQSYKLKVQAVSNGGISDNSEVLVAMTQPVPPSQCKPPKLFKGKPKPTHLSVSWEAPESDGGATVVEYAIMVTSSDLSSREAYRGGEPSCLIAGLQPGEQYKIQVRAINKAGSSSWSDAFDVTTASSAPDAPTKPDVSTRSPHSALVSWNQPKCNGSDIIEYKLEWKSMQKDSQENDTEPNEDVDNDDDDGVDDDDDDEYSSLYCGSSCCYEVTKLTPVSKYSFRVQAANCVGISPHSTPITYCTPAGSPSAVSSLHITMTTATSIKLTWKRPKDNGSIILLYHIDLGSGRIVSVDFNMNEFVLEGLIPETLYKIRMQAVNSVGVGPYGSTVKAMTRSFPPEPPKLEVLSCGSKFIKLKWGDGKSSELLQYCLEISKDGDNYHGVYQGNSQSHKVAKLNESTEYYFRVYAINDAGDGPLSAPVKIRTVKSPPPSVKAPHIVDVNSASCLINWTPAKMPGCHDNFVYILHLLDPLVSNSFQEIYRGELCHHQLINLTVDHEYQVRVCAVRKCLNEDIIGPFSPTTAFNTRVTFMSDASKVSTKQYSSIPSAPPPISLTTSLRELGHILATKVNVGDGMSEMHWAILLMFAFALVAAALAFVAKYAVDINTTHS